MAFTSRDSALVLLLGYNSKAVVDDIPEYFLDVATQEIEERTGAQWLADLVDTTQLLDSTGTSSVFSNVVPIISLTSVKIIHRDESKTNLIVSGGSREVVFNAETGQIQRIGAGDGITLVERGDHDDKISSIVFPEGVANIEVIGRFGEDRVDALLRLISNLIILRLMSKKDPSNYRLDKVSEKIGKYEYRIAPSDRLKDDNQTLTLDGMINYYFSILPKDDAIVVLDV